MVCYVQPAKAFTDQLERTRSRPRLCSRGLQRAALSAVTLSLVLQRLPIRLRALTSMSPFPHPMAPPCYHLHYTPALPSLHYRRFPAMWRHCRFTQQQHIPCARRADAPRSRFVPASVETYGHLGKLIMRHIRALSDITSAHRHTRVVAHECPQGVSTQSDIDAARPASSGNEGRAALVNGDMQQGGAMWWGRGLLNVRSRSRTASRCNTNGTVTGLSTSVNACEQRCG
jgi:hypothetical protein